MKKNSKAELYILVAQFNEEITGNLLKGALKVIEEDRSIAKSKIRVIPVPGSFELPCVAAKIARIKKPKAIIAFGCLIQGDTDHYHYISESVSRGLMDVSIRFELPVLFGVLTAQTEDQAEVRSRLGSRENKGSEVARAALDMIKLFEAGEF